MNILNAMALFSLVTLSCVAQGADNRRLDALSRKESLTKSEIHEVCEAMASGWDGSFEGQCTEEQWARIVARAEKDNKNLFASEEAELDAKMKAAIKRINTKEYYYPDSDDILRNDFFANQQRPDGVIFISHTSRTILLVKRAKFGMEIQYPRADYRNQLRLKRNSMLVEYFPYLRCKTKERKAANLFGEEMKYSMCDEIDRHESEAAQQYIEHSSD